MQKQTIIIITDGKNYETYGSLSEICRLYGYSYLELVGREYPFEHNGWQFIKSTFRVPTGKLTTADQVSELEALLLRYNNNEPEIIEYLKQRELWIE